MPSRRGPPVFLVFALLVALAAFFIVRHQLAAVVLALTFAYLLYPLHVRVRKGVRKDAIASGIVLLLLTLVLLGPFVLLGVLFVEDAARLINDIESKEDVRSEVAGLLERLGLPPGRVDEFSQRIVQETADYLQSQAVPIVTFAAEFLASLLVFYILLFFLLIDGPRLVSYVERVLPADDHEVASMMERIGERVKAIMVGTILVGLVQGALAGVGWWILGLPAPVFWGFVMLVLSLVPLVGAFLVLLPAAVWAFAQGDVFAGVGLLVLNFIMVGLIDDVLRPLLIGKRSGVHPGLVLLGIVGGLPLFGISGLILGPLVMGLVAPLFEAWSRPTHGGSATE